MTYISSTPSAAIRSTARRFVPVRVRVRCCGTMHEISLSRRGRLIFHDHTLKELRREEAFLALGGKRCRCGDVLRAWRDGTDHEELPAGLRRAALDARDVREDRRRAQQRTDPLAAAVFLRRPGVIARLLN